jgi:hypothetical protein
MADMLNGRRPDAPQIHPSRRAERIAAMPRISTFFGIVIEMYFNDHPPPHFHARYSGEEARIAIATGEVLSGSLSPRALRLVREWLGLHRTKLELNFERVEKEEEPDQVEPLK